MPIEFLGIGATNDGSETHRALGRAASTRTTRSASPARTRTTAGTACSPPTGRARPTPRRPRPASRARPSTCSSCSPTGPTSRSRRSRPRRSRRSTRSATAGSRVHFITGGNDHEQRREGDFLHQRRALRPHPRVHPDRQAGRGPNHEPFDHRRRALPSSPTSSRRVPGAAAAPDDLVRRLLGRRVRGGRRRGRHLLPVGRAARRHRRADRARRGRGGRDGRADVPRIQVAFRPILGPDRGEAWEGPRHRRPHRSAPRNEEPMGPHATRAARRTPARSAWSTSPSAASASTARCGPRRHAATGGAGNSNALVGTPETVVAALLDYVDLGVDILSARGYDRSRTRSSSVGTSSLTCGTRSRELDRATARA